MVENLPASSGAVRDWRWGDAIVGEVLSTIRPAGMRAALVPRIQRRLLADQGWRPRESLEGVHPWEPAGQGVTNRIACLGLMLVCREDVGICDGCPFGWRIDSLSAVIMRQPAATRQPPRLHPTAQQAKSVRAALRRSKPQPFNGLMPLWKAWLESAWAGRSCPVTGPGNGRVLRSHSRRTCRRVPARALASTAKPGVWFATGPRNPAPTADAPRSLTRLKPLYLAGEFSAEDK